MDELQFLRPIWLLLLIPALTLVWLWSRQANGSSKWANRIEPELLQVLLEPSATESGSSFRWLTLALMALTALGLAGPTWERVPQPVVQNNDALVVVLDLSLSMYVEDVRPSRLIRARQEITDILRLREQGFTALVAYAGDAHTVAPLTDDTRTIENLLSSLSPDMMPVLGSNVDAALTLAKSLMENAGMLQGRILLVTDGVDRVNDVTSHAQRDYPISILGIGTPDGGPIPLDFANQPGRHLQTNQGDVIKAKLDNDRLANIAEHCHGVYRAASVGDADIEQVLQTPIPGDESTTQSDRQFDSWLDQGYWLVLLALPLLLLTFRRGLLVAALPALSSLLLLSSLLTLAPPAQAGFWDDLWQRSDQQGYQRLIEGEPEYAVPLLGDSDWASVAKYRSGAFADAAQDFSTKAAQPTEPATTTLDSLGARYNLGNALAHLGDYQRAISTYETVLAEQPDHADAKFNKELLEKLLSEQQQADSEDNAEEQDQGGEKGEQKRDSQDQQQNDEAQQNEEEQDAGENEQEQQSEDEQAEQEEQNQESSESEQLAEAQESRDENEDALEQWLRRVPDDPGGLLKRKFKYEHKQRLRSGDYQNRQAEKIW